MDDIEDNWIEFANLTVMNTFLSKNQNLSLGLIMNRIGTNTKLMAKIREGVQRGLFELALHGWDHIEYSDQSDQEQHDSLKKANEKMHELFGLKSNIFIPPFNSFNDSTLKALQKLDMSIISQNIALDKNISYATDQEGHSYDTYQIYHLPQTASFETFPTENELSKLTVNQLLIDVDFSLKKYGYAVVGMHPQSFVKIQDGKFSSEVDEQQINNLNYVIDSVMSKNIHIVSFSKLLEKLQETQELSLVQQRKQLNEKNLI
jgi:peptidoglycan/xylan/chitin deacetylase (PgdA/CDA1 family)